MPLAGVELETLVSEPDALTTGKYMHHGIVLRNFLSFKTMVIEAEF